MLCIGSAATIAAEINSFAILKGIYIVLSKFSSANSLCLVSIDVAIISLIFFINFSSRSLPSGRQDFDHLIKF